MTLTGILLTIERWAAPRRKALVAVLTPVVTVLLARWGFSLDTATTTTLVALITGVVVHETPNGPPTTGADQ